MTRISILNKFLLVFAFLSLIAVILFYINGCEFRKRQERIVDIYERHIAKQDSIRISNVSSISRLCREKEEKVRMMLSDSAIDNIPSLCDKQRIAVKLFIKPCWEVSTKELISTDSIKNVPTSDSDEKNEIKTLLELEFNKIQSEYESLEIWAALITIVFLVFSFYSLFKLERIEDQAMNKVKELGELNKMAQIEIDTIHNDFEDYKKNVENSINDIFHDSQAKLNQFHGGMNRHAEAFKTKIVDMLSTNENALKRLQEIYSKKTEEADELLAALSEKLESQNKDK